MGKQTETESDPAAPNAAEHECGSEIDASPDELIWILQLQDP